MIGLLVGAGLYLIVVLIIYLSLFSAKALPLNFREERRQRVGLSFALPFIVLRFVAELVVWTFCKEEV
jgi:hypothetical protein